VHARCSTPQTTPTARRQSPQSCRCASDCAPLCNCRLPRAPQRAMRQVRSPRAPSTSPPVKPSPPSASASASSSTDSPPTPPAAVSTVRATDASWPPTSANNVAARMATSTATTSTLISPRASSVSTDAGVDAVPFVVSADDETSVGSCALNALYQVCRSNMIMTMRDHTQLRNDPMSMIASSSRAAFRRLVRADESVRDVSSSCVCDTSVCARVTVTGAVGSLAILRVCMGARCRSRMDWYETVRVRVCTV
jgi:hypothetical protein